MLLKIVLLFVFINCICACNIRKAQYGFICVCNSTNCDSVPKIGNLTKKEIKIYYTSQEKPGFNTKFVNFTGSEESSAFKITINDKIRYQKIIGFGGAFTDSTGINIKSLSREGQRKLLLSYFGEDGIGYNLCRVPIGGTDFSMRKYSYDDVDGDAELKHFALQPEDFEYKVN